MIKEGRKTLLDNDKIDQRAKVSMRDLQGIRTTMYYKNNNYNYNNNNNYKTTLKNLYIFKERFSL